MAAGITYTPIATTTLSSAQLSVSFSSISGSYTDLVVVMSGKASGASTYAAKFTFNDDTGTNYSMTEMTGNGSSASSSRTSSANNIDNLIVYNNDISNAILHIMNYSNTTTYKTVIGRTNVAGWGTRAGVGLWRSTSAITKITIEISNATTFASGSTFSLYGITAA